MNVEVWTDGSGTTSGPWGWAALLCAEHGGKKVERELCGYGEDGTNNVAELTAVIEGLNAITRACHVKVITDSQYVMFGFVPGDGRSDGRVERWKRKGWRTSTKEPVKNRELWERLDAAIGRHLTVHWEHVKGHTGIENNERVDVLAGKARGVAKGEIDPLELLGATV